MSSSTLSAADRERYREKYRKKLAKALTEDDDPLATYNQFVQWTVKHYGEKDRSSGLLELLKDATNQFKDDPMYKNDLRYLKMWALYARQLERSQAAKIYAFLVEKEIGTTYSALYEDYANLLEREGRRSEAEKIYLQGIEKQVRPLERLKTRYKEFQARASQAAAQSNRSIPSGSRSASLASIASAPSTTSANLVSFNSTAASRYALMLAPTPPGKRPEKLKFNMGLLWTDDGVEYSIQEARARSMGLLGKKWGPPPPSELPYYASLAASSSSTTPVDFNDDNMKSTRTMGMRRRSMLGGAEPTVTINTKEALADVFGMYNSPEKTHKFTPGSKHAPLKKIEPATPMVIPKPTFSNENENAKTPSLSFRPFVDENAKTPSLSFRPFVDENAQSKMTTPAPSKLNVFVDEQNKTPFITPRSAFGLKDTTTPSLTQPRNENAPRSAFKPLSTLSEESADKPVFSKVFNPPQTDVPLAPLRDVFTDDHGKPVPKPKAMHTHERAKSHDIGADSKSPAFTPFVDENAKTPFKVFSLPGTNDENALGRANPFTPKTPTPAVFTPFVDPKPEPAFTPFGSSTNRAFTPFADKTPAQSTAFKPEPEPEPEHEAYEEEHQQAYEEEEVYAQEEEYSYDEEHIEQYQAPLAPEHIQEGYDEGSSYHHEAPLGGRFGQFSVMTPIAERTCEFTTSTRGGTTPSDRYGRPQDGEGSPKSKHAPFLRDELVAARDARRLEAELQDDTSEELMQGRDEGEDEEAYGEDQGGLQLEERTGALSLVDTLTLNSKFRPPNPCNPFDPPIMSTLLSRVQTDSHFYDLREYSSQKLDQLQKFFKKGGRKNSTTVTDLFPLTLENNRFMLSEKLGEGGFGSVYKARDLGMRTGDDDDDDDDDDFDDFDDDEENASMVAIKVVKPRNLWEYHALRRLHSALPANLRRSLVLPHGLYAYGDESFLILDLCTQGMLLDIVNNAASAGISQAGACLDELLVIFFTIELLRLVEGMHSAGFIHGDLKIDNCLLRLEDVPGGAAAWSSLYQPSGEGGWQYKGLKVIDFGRTIDTRLFPADQQFIAEWPTDERDCFEIREGRPWTYQTDYFGLAGIIYCMLFGKYITSSAVVQVQGQHGETRYKIGTPLKRYWQADLWNRLFDILLNPTLIRPGGELPLPKELAGVRVDMEAWLQANCNRTSNTLKGLLKKVEMSCYR
ncbi:other/BUB protein kinase [Coprinopsis cinerea okayama7|uniref:Other/BUB protein kinase n=1 Tax=Coprinopsis cinerea (strain Okayama-7 / 130 / ATCC MYA-4618 / FGSC 9003) TaxID=240176 RepID=A8NUD6_COPC7|nr:other/BUB protein kinase [Coprinopsis cinerea okayama7\|eukprot:XP_001836431.1 other/BUB protein kinase [Coprinopsis cinerea okayama7\